MNEGEKVPDAMQSMRFFTFLRVKALKSGQM
jgi:hypothetical protein